MNTNRRRFLTTGAASALAATAVARADHHGAKSASAPVLPPASGKRILLSVKLGMIAKKIDGKDLTLTERLRLAGEAGLDGVDFDQAGQGLETRHLFFSDLLNFGRWFSIHLEALHLLLSVFFGVIEFWELRSETAFAKQIRACSFSYLFIVVLTHNILS